jgi:hypothetical protein
LLLELKELTEPTPMKFNRGFAPDMRNMACMRPSMLPMINADEADGICLLSLPFLTISKLPTLDLYAFSYVPDKENRKDYTCLLHQLT